jgi:threonine dehydrogenase-like Zn-dependent dehydrogenase
LTTIQAQEDTTVQVMTVVPGKPDTAAVATRPEPDERDGSVLVEGLAVGICGTDREIIHSGAGAPPPGRPEIVLGHESLGRVLDAPDGSGPHRGDLVVGIVRRPDDCPTCARDEWDFCRTGRYTERGIKEADGYGAQRWRADPKYLVRLEPGLHQVGVLLEPTSVVAKAWAQIDLIRRRCWDGSRVALITGAGPIGLLAALLAVQRGYQTHLFDLATSGPKPELAAALGATYHTGTINDLPIRPDVVVEATGVGDLVFDLLDQTGPNSVVCLSGINPGTHTVPIPANLINRLLVMGNGAVFGTVNAGPRNYQQAAQALAAADRGWLERLITRRVPLSSWTDALRPDPTDVKVVVDLTR